MRVIIAGSYYPHESLDVEAADSVEEYWLTFGEGRAYGAAGPRRITLTVAVEDGTDIARAFWTREPLPVSILDKLGRVYNFTARVKRMDSSLRGLFVTLEGIYEAG